MFLIQGQLGENKFGYWTEVPTYLYLKARLSSTSKIELNKFKLTKSN